MLSPTECGQMECENSNLEIIYIFTSDSEDYLVLIVLIQRELARGYQIEYFSNYFKRNDALYMNI